MTQSTVQVMQENSRLHSEVSGLQKLCELHKQDAKAAAEGLMLRNVLNQTNVFSA